METNACLCIGSGGRENLGNFIMGRSHFSIPVQQTHYWYRICRVSEIHKSYCRCWIFEACMGKIHVERTWIIPRTFCNGIYSLEQENRAHKIVSIPINFKILQFQSIFSHLFIYMLYLMLCVCCIIGWKWDVKSMSNQLLKQTESDMRQRHCNALNILRKRVLATRHGIQSWWKKYIAMTMKLINLTIN